MMTPEEIDQLFDDNITQLDKLDIRAVGAFKGLLDCIERNTPKTYIKLKNPEVGGHSVEFDIIEGEQDTIMRCGRSLGFNVYPDKIESHH